jgi:hypothetical protein
VSPLIPNRLKPAELETKRERAARTLLAGLVIEQPAARADQQRLLAQRAVALADALYAALDEQPLDEHEHERLQAAWT